MEISFDVKGNLTPYHSIEVSFTVFYKTFVDNFSSSTSRHRIFQVFEKFILQFQEEMLKEFVIWIDGSFVTKKENPNDIDLLVFLDFDFYKKNEKKLSEYKTLSFWKETGLDLYFLIEYPEDNKNKFISDIDKIYWLNQFSKTSPDSKGKQFSKGFIQIKII